MREPEKSGNNFEEWLLMYWGRDGRVGYGVLQMFVNLAKEYGWAKVYNAVEISAGYNKKSFKYAEAIVKSEGKSEAKANIPKIENSVICSHCDKPIPEKFYDKHLQSCEPFQKLPQMQRRGAEIKALSDILKENRE